MINFTLNFAWNSNGSNRNVVFQLPADNPGLDERLEFFYFNLESIQGGGGGSGFDFTSAMADPHQQLLFPVQQSSHTQSVLFDFTTGTCPSNWGTNCWSVEPNATVVGSVTPNAVDADIVLLSETYLAYDANATKRVCSVYIGSNTYRVGSVQHGLILGNRREVQFSIISPNLPGTNWQDVKFGFCDGTFNPSMEDTGVQRVANKATLDELY